MIKTTAETTILIFLVLVMLFMAAAFDSSLDHEPSALEIYYRTCHEKGWPKC